MAKQGTSTATPRLRFPEFLEAAAWKDEKMEELIDTISPPTKLPTSSYLATGKFPIIDQSQDAISGWTDDAQALVVEPLPLIVFGDHTCALKFVERPFAQGADGIKILAAKPAVSIEYLFQSLNYRPLVMEDYKRHFSTLKERLVFFPAVESGEQQKIADCLTSLDEVIAAQGRKVEALKAHKRGLMQQLFPREGETRPRLRFPEFRNAPEWEERPLGQVIEVASGQVDPTESPYRDWPHVGGENIESETGNLSGLKSAREDGVTSGKYLFDERDVLYSKIRPVLNKVAVPNFSGICSADIYPIRPSNGDITRQFLVYLLRSVSFVDYAAKHSERGKIPKINREALAAYAAALPQPVEQQRIADCLSSLDTEITTESHQLATLKTHKQGLMQQLFPTTEMVS